MAIRHVVFAAPHIGDRGGVTSAIAATATELARRGLTVSYLSMKPSVSAPAVPGHVFEASRGVHRTSLSPLASEYPGPLGLTYVTKRALTPAWKAFRQMRLRSYMRGLTTDTCIVAANPDTLREMRSLGMTSAGLTGPYLLGHVHTNEAGLTETGWDKDMSVFDACDALVCLDDETATALEGRTGLPCVAIPTPPRISAPAARNARPRHGGPRVLSYFGRLSQEKDVHRIIRLFAAVVPQAPAWTLHIWGDGPERAVLEDMVSQLDMEDRIQFRGWATEPALAFADSDLHIMMSRFEGQGLSALEALACGVPTVGLPASAFLRNLLNHSGFTLTDGDDDAVSAQLSKVLADEVGIAERRERAATVLEQHSSVRAGDRWISLFEDLASARTKTR